MRRLRRGNCVGVGGRWGGADAADSMGSSGGCEIDVGGGDRVAECEGLDDGIEFGFCFGGGLGGEHGFEFDEGAEVGDEVDVDAGGFVDEEVAGFDEFARGAEGVGEGGDEGIGVGDGGDVVVGGAGVGGVGAAVGDEFAALSAADASEFEAGVGSGEEVVVLFEESAVGGAEAFGGGFGGGKVGAAEFLFEILHGPSRAIGNDMADEGVGPTLLLFNHIRFGGRDPLILRGAAAGPGVVHWRFGRRGQGIREEAAEREFRRRAGRGELMRQRVRRRGPGIVPRRVARRRWG